MASNIQKYYFIKSKRFRTVERGLKLSEINNLFNLLLHSKLVETFSKGSAIFLLAVFIILLLFCAAYIIIGTISNNYFSKRFLTCWIIGSVLLSLFATFFVGRSFDCISKTGKPIKYEYTATATKSANKSILQIANEFPYVLILNDPNHNSNANTQYYIFSNSSDEIKNFNTEFNTDGPYQLIFLKTDSNTVVIKANFSENLGTLENYQVVKNVGLPSDEWGAKFKNTNQMKIQDLMQ